MGIEKILIIVAAASIAAAAGAGAAMYSGLMDERGPASVGPTPGSTPALADGSLACTQVLAWCSGGTVLASKTQEQCDVFRNVGQFTPEHQGMCKVLLGAIAIDTARTPSLGLQVNVQPTAVRPMKARDCAWIMKRCAEIDPNRNPVLAAVGGADVCGMVKFSYAINRGWNPETHAACGRIAKYFEPGAFQEIPAGIPVTGGLFGRGVHDEPIFEYVEDVEYEDVEYEP